MTASIRASTTSRSENGPRWRQKLLFTRAGRTTVRLAAVAAILLFWQLMPMDRSAKMWASDPAAIVATLWDWILDGSLWHHLGATLLVMSLGYVIGCAVGAALGLVFGFFPFFYRILAPYISAFYALPKIALAPLFIILLGVGVESKVALVALTVFFLVLNSTIEGARNVDPDSVEGLILMGSTRSEIVAKVLLPASMPWIFTGMRIAVRYAFTNTLLAELIAANSGLGYLIQYNSATFDSSGVYASILVLVVFSVTLTEILTRLEKHLGARHE